jgi:hypothetical protein
MTSNGTGRSIAFVAKGGGLERGCVPNFRRSIGRDLDFHSWATFFREVCGVDGLVSRLYPEFEERCRFQESPAYDEIRRMLAALRSRGGFDDGSGVETTRVITVRLPKSLHKSLLRDAGARQTSMNQLCINRLLQLADEPVEAA